MSFRISVQEKPQARKNSILKLSEREYQVSVHAAPVAAKANEAVAQLLANYFSVPKSSVKLLRGQSSRKATRDRLTTPKRLKPSFRQLRLSNFILLNARRVVGARISTSVKISTFTPEHSQAPRVCAKAKIGLLET
jgi:uncharacterized protein